MEKHTPAHRDYVAKLYGIWLRKYGLPATLRSIRRAKRFIWTNKGFDMAQRRVLIAQGAA